MNNTLKKIIKGTIAIFAIKLMLIAGIFTFQACETNDDDTILVEVAKDNFLSSLKISQEKINSIPVGNSKTPLNPKGDNSISSARDMQGATETLCLMSLEEFTEDIVDDINNLSDLIETKTNNNLDLIAYDGTSNTNDTSEDDTNDCIGLYTIPAQPVSDALDPAIQEAKNYLISSYGLTNQEINNIIINENGQEEDLIPLVMTMVNAENNNGTTFNYLSLFGEATYAQSMGDIGQCAIAAIGADIIWSLGSDGGKWTKKAIKKAFGAVAKRLLGPIGVAIAVVSFGLCVANAAIEAA